MHPIGICTVLVLYVAESLRREIFNRVGVTGLKCIIVLNFLAIQ